MKSKTLRKWHTYLGLSSAAFFFLLSITGILLTFRATFSSPKPSVPMELQTSTPIDTSALLKKAAQTIDSDISFISFPKKPSAPTRIRFRDSKSTTLYYAPDGTLVGTTDNTGFNFNRLLFDLHTGAIMGRPGELFIAFCGLCLLVSLVSGLLIWPRWVRSRKQKLRSRAARHLG